MKILNQAINLSDALDKNSDMSSRENQILIEIIKKIGFVPKENIWRSKYWGKNLGASHWLGKYNKKSAVLKIQGVKPDISEIYMISEFSKQNKSKLIRPPDIHKSISWNDSTGYEAIITDHASGHNIIIDGKLITKENIATFLNYYREYRINCIPEKPWLPAPLVEDDWNISLDKLVTNSVSAFPNHPFRDSEDINLAKDAYKILEKIYKNVKLEFMHGHFSCKDLIYENQNSNKVVIFSNLFWKWRYPYFDAVFAYHWFMYELARVKNITPYQVEKQRKLWLGEIFKITGANISIKKRRLLNAALLERSVAGFIIDSFLCDSKKPISKYLYESTKSETKRLMKELGGV